MKLKEFDYKLSKERIAQEPMRPRDHSRLLVITLRGGTTNAAHANIHIEHRHFYNLPEYLRAGDVLVLNNTKVMPARLIGRKAGTGGIVEVFLLRKTAATIHTPALCATPLKRGIRIPVPDRPTQESGGETWQCLLGGHGRKEGLAINFKNKLKARVLRKNQDGTWLVKFNQTGGNLMKTIERIGQTPLPPYIKRKKVLSKDRQDYQAVYAVEEKSGSVAAPTAGLHFTPALLKKLKNKGVKLEYLTLQVGLGTFAPVKTERIEGHRLHREWYEINKKTLAEIIKAKKAGRRIVAVGTTSVRAIEAAFSKFPKKSKILNPKSKILSGWTDIFIYPGYKFRAVDALITNFHLPKSSLLMLVSAFADSGRRSADGLKKIKRVYQLAIKKGYRFYSYGDAMLIK